MAPAAGRQQRCCASVQPRSSRKYTKSSLRRGTCPLFVCSVQGRWCHRKRLCDASPNGRDCRCASLPTHGNWLENEGHSPFKAMQHSALSSRAFAADGQAVSVLHTMAVLKVYQAKLLHVVEPVCHKSHHASHWPVWCGAGAQQKSSQAMRHFLPKRASSSTAFSRTKTALPTQQQPRASLVPIHPRSLKSSHDSTWPNTTCFQNGKHPKLELDPVQLK